MASVTYLCCFLSVLLAVSARPNIEEVGHNFQQIIQADDTDGYDFATLYRVDDVTSTRARQTRRGLQDHVDSPANQLSYALRLTSGDELLMSLQRQSVNMRGAQFTEVTKDGHRQHVSLPSSDCFFSGDLVNGQGFASLSLCDERVLGSISTPERVYELHSVDADSDDEPMKVLVTWSDIRDDALNDEDDTLTVDENEEESTPVMVKRSAADRSGTVEVCVVVDHLNVALLKQRLHISNSSQILQLIITKWTAIAHKLSNKTQVGWALDIRLVRVEIWNSNPSWYNAIIGDKLGARMNKICQGSKNWTCDQLTLYTANITDIGKLGLAWVGGLCSHTHRCSAVRNANAKYQVELHEFGHSLGLPHDWKTPLCINGTDPMKGFMGSHNLHFRACYKTILERKLGHEQCIFQNAVDTHDIVADLGQG